MALSIKISSYVSGGFTGDVIRWKLKETGTGIYIDEHEEPGPHGTVYNFSFVNNIRDIVYTIEMYDVPPGGGLGNLIKSHDVTVSTTTINFDSDIELVVDGGEDIDPVAGESSVIIPETLGKNYRVVQRGIGQLLKNRLIEFTPNLIVGGFSLTGGHTFEPNDIYIVQFLPEVVTNPPGSVVNEGVDVIVANYNVQSSDFGKLLIADGVLPVLTLTLPADIPEKTFLTIESIGTVNINVVIVYPDLSTFILGKKEGVRIIKADGTIYSFSNAPDIKLAGELDWGYKLGLNRVWADGAEYNQADYPRLMKAVALLNPLQVKASYAEWNTTIIKNHITQLTPAGPVYETKVIYPNHGFFAVYGTKFRVPDLRNMTIRALKNNAGADDERIVNIAGGYQIDAFKEHGHEWNYGVDRDDNGNGNDSHEFTMRGYGLYYGGVKPVPIGRTGGVETRSENIGLIPMIIV